MPNQQGKALFFQKACLCLRVTPTTGPCWAEGAVTEKQTCSPQLCLFPLPLLSSVLPPNTGCVCPLRSFLGKKLPNQKPLPVPGGKK